MKVTQILLALLSLLALLLFIRLWTGVGSFPGIWELEDQIAQQKNSNEEQLQLNTQLQSDVTELGENDEAIESHARSELGMIKKNETFYQVIMQEDKQELLIVAPEPGEGGKTVE
ncbi:MAG: Cell division protein FtsB [uncultured Thiotrichaceae bacterium]|uniref:Cell division protein FtsB n=1 Tax=uncultured Thiotrichaceae bacterium TaxID=298394 RepID=A0A6S6TNB9_9GAMM|nr:MAG: Cell division protein FtsB [uncultured Thiotrichaceae bacterium]